MQGMKKIVTKKTEVGSKEEGPAERIKKLFEGFKISARTSAVAAWNIGKILEEQFLLLDQQKYGQREKWFNESGFEFNIRTANRWRKLYKDYPLQTDCPNLLTDAYWLTDKEETPKTSKNRSGSKQKADKVGKYLQRIKAARIERYDRGRAF
jgi:hypothetical protein